MYLLQWNPAQSKIEAGIGATVTLGEVQTFAQDVLSMIEAYGDRCKELVLDRSRVRRYEFGALEAVIALEEECHQRNIPHITTVVSQESEAVELIGQRLQEVLEGRDEIILSDRAA